MKKFAIGDRVFRKASPHFGPGVVFHIEPIKGGLVYILFDNETKVARFIDTPEAKAIEERFGVNPRRVWTTNLGYEDNYEFLEPYKVGDRVVSLYRPSGATLHDHATIVDADSPQLLLIKYDRDVGGHSGRDIHGTSRAYWWVHPTDLRKVTPEEPPKEKKPSKVFSPDCQCGKLLTHLASGKSITPLQAFGTLGVYRLAARIHELRQAGHKIVTTIKYDEQGKPYASYSLKSRRF